MYELFKYISLAIFVTILLWRLWGKLEGALVIIGLCFLGYSQCSKIEISSIFNINNQKRREDIIALSQMTINERAGEMYKRKLAEKIDGNALIYPADMKKDYYKFFPSNPGNFIIAFSNGSEFENFFKSIDSLVIKDKKMVGCPDGKAYQLTPDCFVCKIGFQRQFQRFILSVSRKLDSSLPDKTIPAKEKNKAPKDKLPPKVDTSKYIEGDVG